MRARSVTPIGLSFLDAMTCGLGAVILLFMIINGAVRDNSVKVTSDLQGEVDRLEREVLDGHRNLVELRNAILETDDERVLTQGLALRMIESLKEIRVELATFEDSTLARASTSTSCRRTSDHWRRTRVACRLRCRPRKPRAIGFESTLVTETANT